jgi:hypothetical protein
VRYPLSFERGIFIFLLFRGAWKWIVVSLAGKITILAGKFTKMAGKMDKLAGKCSNLAGKENNK